MFTSETERRVAKLFYDLAKNQGEVEKAINDLKNSDSFDPRKLFDLIDQDKKGLINEYDILRFLKKHSIQATPNEIRFIFFFLKVNEMAIDIFVNDFLRCTNYNFGMFNENNSLRELIKLGRVFEKEIALIKDLSLYCNSIIKRFDFTIKDLMIIIGRNEDSFCPIDLLTFLQKHGFFLTLEEINLIFQILDIKKLGKITKEVMNDLLYLNIQKERITPNSEGLYQNNVNTTTNNLLEECEEKIDPLAFSFKKASNAIKGVDNLEIAFLNYLSFLIEIENEIEQIKNQLTFRTDFIVSELFKIFDSENKGYFSTDEFLEACHTFGLNPSKEDAARIIKRYSQVNTTDLYLSDFREMIIPFYNKDYRDIILRRNSATNNFYVTPRRFTQTTQNLFKNLLSVLINAEQKVEKEKEKLPVVFEEYLKKILFPKINHKTAEDGVTINELFCYLTYSNIIALEKEIYLVFHRFDKENKGVIGIKEIFD